MVSITSKAIILLTFMYCALTIGSSSAKQTEEALSPSTASAQTFSKRADSPIKVAIHYEDVIT